MAVGALWLVQVAFLSAGAGKQSECNDERAQAPVEMLHDYDLISEKVKIGIIRAELANGPANPIQVRI